MHRASAVTLVLFMLAKELVSLPDHKDVLNVHLHLDELADHGDGESGGNKNIETTTKTAARYDGNARLQIRTDPPIIQKICTNVICNANRRPNQGFNYWVCCIQNQGNGYQRNGNHPSGYQANYGYQPSGYQGNGYQPSGYQANYGYQPSGYQANGYQPSGN